MTKTLDLDAMGQSLDKLYLWARDMLGNFHDTTDTKVPPDGVLSPDSASGSFDPASGLYYGGSRVDGFDGQLYTAEAISKTLYLTSRLAYNGTTLGALDPATYDPMNGIKYFAHRIQVTETVVDPSMPHQPTVLTVVDANSHLFDQLSYLGAVVGFHNMMDPNNTGSDHRAYHNVFDGDPFAGPFAMTGVPGPFDLMSGTSRALFLNIMAMHYNTVAGTFVDVASLNGNNVVQGTDISAINAGMALTVLAKFSGEFAATALGTSADSALTAQANYIIAHLKDPSGGYYNSFSLGTGPSTAAKTLGAQAAIVRGLYEAFLATNTMVYLNEANAGYNNMIDAFYVSGQHVFRTVAGNDLALYAPMDLALLTGALRDARLAGLQMEADDIYARVFKTVYKKMMLTEAEETGETGGDSDGDGIPYIVGGTRPFAFVAQGQFAMSPLDVQGSLPRPVVASVYPDPATTSITLDLQLPNSKELGMTLYDLQGHFMGSVLPVSYGAGEQKVIIPTASYPNGTYYIRTVQGNSIVSINRFEVSR